ncbi:TetR/AcrR family transcriptional regulator [Mycobacteroides chelonae]|uniref:TetR/AcrR family transcriptional regulator n=1 Tax=Mycobacteroides chelonae TaxID=1774 RepID=UPI00099392B1|nr:TetR/AcrR family transcriptional regulator [Mycobacteroides chelonae]
MAATKRAYGGIPAEQRRAERRLALLDAVYEIVGTHGSVKLTVTGLCRHAGLAERYYYESFTDLSSVVNEVFDQVLAELGRTILERVAEVPPSADLRVRAGIAAALEALTEDPRRMRIIFTEAQTNAALNARRTEVARGFADIVLAQLGPDTILRAGERAHLAAGYFVGGLYETILGGRTGHLR